ncbi:MAG: sulfatase [Bacteroidota bacterium]
MKTKLSVATLTIAIMLIIVLLYSGCSQKETQPNFIIILADNLGYGDIACFGSDLHRTPNIDNLANEGMRLTSFYSASGVCTPSRASLMTGCYAQRVDMHLSENGLAVLRPVSSKGLNPEEITIADILKEKGYSTACIGKWHLGDQPECLPLRHGFDYYYGIPYSEDMIPSFDPSWPDLPLIENDTVVEAPVDLATTTRRYVKEAIRFITENQDKPFFLYFPHNLPGSRAIPIVDKKFAGKSANGPWGDAIEEIDWSVGQIIKRVKELGLEKNTIIVFTSDNGAPQGLSGSSKGGSNEPFSGAGYTTMEGGMRVPAIVKWSGSIPEGRSNDELCTMMDWLPTFADLAGAQISQDRIIDGKNIWPLLSGDESAKTPYKVFYYYFMDQLQAVREGNWKLHLAWDNKYDGIYKSKLYGNSKLQLVDLGNDVKEEYDVSEQYPEVVERLLQYAETISKELGDPQHKGEQIQPALYVNNPKPLIKKLQ